jgi:hypothetical protein
MTFTTKPPHLERFAVVVMMLLGRRVLAYGARLGQEFPPALVYVGISTGIGAVSLL